MRLERHGQLLQRRRQRRCEQGRRLVLSGRERSREEHRKLHRFLERRKSRINAEDAEIAEDAENKAKCSASSVYSACSAFSPGVSHFEWFTDVCLCPKDPVNPNQSKRKSPRCAARSWN